MRGSLFLLLAACGADESAPPPAGCADPLAFALQDGSCVRPGVLPGGCAPGFVHDGGYGCEPILPAEPCPPGLMAVPGDSECRPVMPCGAGRWGDIAVEEGSQHVDALAAATESDGSAARPWTSIAEAIAAAAPGALVAVAAGSYRESLVIDKHVRLEGVCPEQVVLVGTGVAVTPCPAAALCLVPGASGSEVRGLSVTGPGIGILMSGAEQVLLEQIRVHDCDDSGFHAQPDLGPTSVTLRGMLIDQNHEVGLSVIGSVAMVEASVVRGTLPRASDQKYGRGIAIQESCPLGMCDAGERASAVVTGSVIENNHEEGLFVSGSDATVTGSVVRGTLPAADQTGGRGIDIRNACEPLAPAARCGAAGRSNLVVTGSLVEQNHEFGVSIAGSDATVTDTVVRGTRPSASDQRFGQGIHVQLSCGHTPSGFRCDPDKRGSATVMRTLVDQNHDLGVFAGVAELTLEASVVRGTLPRASDGLFGDGVTVVTDYASRSSATIGHSLVVDSARAGLSIFGASVSLGSTRLGCAAFSLAAQAEDGEDFAIEDRGDNRCGCPVADGECKITSVALEPPAID